MTDAAERFLDAIQKAYNSEDTTLHFSYESDFAEVSGSIKALRGTLEVLHLDNNYSLRALPCELGELGRLRWLNASYCRLTTVPAELGRLSHLERLHLSNNLLSWVPMELWQLKNLEELRLDNNQLQFLPGGLLFLPRLKELMLENNPLLCREEVRGAAPAALIPPIPSTDCANCCARMHNYEVLLTFHNIAKNVSVPFVHCVCSATCKGHLEHRLAEYDTDHPSPKCD